MRCICMRNIHILQVVNAADQQTALITLACQHCSCAQLAHYSRPLCFVPEYFNQKDTGHRSGSNWPGQRYTHTLRPHKQEAGADQQCVCAQMLVHTHARHASEVLLICVTSHRPAQCADSVPRAAHCTRYDRAQPGMPVGRQKTGTRRQWHCSCCDTRVAGHRTLARTGPHGAKPFEMCSAVHLSKCRRTALTPTAHCACHYIQ